MREVVWQLSSNVVVAQSHYQHLVTPFQRQDAYICAHLLIFTFPHEQVSLKWSYERANNDLLFCLTLRQIFTACSWSPPPSFRWSATVGGSDGLSLVPMVHRWMSRRRRADGPFTAAAAATAAAATSPVSIHFRRQ